MDGASAATLSAGPVKRTAAGVLALAGLVPFHFMAFTVLLTAAIVSEGPDPSGERGDPCCEPAETWGEVAIGVAFSIVGWMLTACLVVGLWWLAIVAARGRAPRLRWRAIPVGMIGAVVLVAVDVAFLAVADPLWN